MSTAMSLAESMLKSGNPAGAYRILMDFPDKSPQRAFLLGQCALRLGDNAGAISALAMTLAADPRHGEAAYLLGELYLRLGMTDKAEALVSKFLKRSDDDGVRLLRAHILAGRKQIKDAIAECATVLTRSPGNWRARQARGDLLVSQGRNAEAVADYRGVVALRPDEAAAWANLGIIESGLRHFDEAARCLRQAVALQPGNTVCLYELSWVLIASGEAAEAEEILARLRKLDPVRVRKMEEAAAGDRRLPADMEFDARAQFLSQVFDELCDGDWTHRAKYDRVFADYAASPRSNSVRRIHCAGVVPLDLMLKRHLLEHAASLAGEGIVPRVHAPAPAPERLRLGYILPRIGDHVVPRILDRVWAAHAEVTDLFVVTTGLAFGDRTHPRLQGVLAMPGVTWLDLTDRSEQEAAQALLDLRLDVLVDAAIYNDNARPRLLAYRPAPVQVNYLGAPFTSGAPWMDYIITDVVVSPGVPGWCSEAEVALPGSYFVFGHELASPPAVPPRSELGLPEGVFIYSGLHNAYKIDPGVFDCWMRILQATPGSVLLLRGGDKLEQNFIREAAARGVGRERLVFAAHLDEVQYLARQGAVDLFLDAWCYNGHTTMAESLWMGVPAITCPGTDFQTRVGASLLKSCGLDEMVVDAAGYEALAVALFHDRERLARLRATLHAGIATATPFDPVGKARSLEKAYRHMRQRFAEGLPPAPFAVADLP